MTFRRTALGLSNLHLFIDAEAVVFLEGGVSISREDVENGEYSTGSDDIRYWKALFKLYLPSRKLQFRSVGSKQTVKSIALDIKNGDTKNVIAVMDRDFDHLTSMIEGDNILYTYGYAWENDCWSVRTISESVISLAGLCPSKLVDIEDEVNDFFCYFRRKMKQAVKADSLMIQNSQSFFNREQPARYIQTQADGKPEINTYQIMQSFLNAREKVGRPIFRTTELAIDPIYDCFGHLLAYFSYRVVSYFLRSVYKLPVVAKEYATAVIIEKFVVELSNGSFPDLKEHYDCTFSRITA
jgi:hypothetical protein